MRLVLDTLKVLPLFSDLSHHECESVIRNSRIRQCEHGQFLFVHGDIATHFYIICRGTMQMFRETPDGHEVTSDILIAGDSIGAEEVVQLNSSYQSNARAVDDATLLEVPISWMKEHLNDFDHLALKLLKDISTRLRSAQIETEHLSTMSAAQIVACYLQKLCVLYNFDPHGFELPYSKTLIASRLHMELETFSRSLKKLKEQGLVVKGTHVSFSKSHKASHFACGNCSVSEDCPTHQQLHAKLHGKHL